MVLVDLQRQMDQYDSVIKKLLKKVSLEGFEDRYSSSMSGGEQQRVALARALANKPDVMLLDEPFGSLDSSSKFEIALDILPFPFITSCLPIHMFGQECYCQEKNAEKNAASRDPRPHFFF